MSSSTSLSDPDCDSVVSEDSDDVFRSRTQSASFEEPGAGEVFVHGERIYNNTTWAYRLPADQLAFIRQDNQHYLLSQELPGLYRGPVEEVLRRPGRMKRILDIGCGTGIWLAEMAELFPEADCVGIDVMPAQHDQHQSNCTFMFVEAPIGMSLFPDASFDVIQIRQMSFSVTDFGNVVAEAFRVLRPDGIILVHECSMIIESGWPGRTVEEIAPATAKWASLLYSALESRGIDLAIFDHMPAVLAASGFDGDEIDSYLYYRQFCTESFEGQVDHTVSFVEATRLILVEGGQMDDDDELDDLIACVGQELRDDANEGLAYLLGRWGYWWVIKA